MEYAGGGPGKAGCGTCEDAVSVALGLGALPVLSLEFSAQGSLRPLGWKRFADDAFPVMLGAMFIACGHGTFWLVLHPLIQAVFRVTRLGGNFKEFILVFV